MPKLTVKTIDHGWREIVAMIDSIKKQGLVAKAGILGAQAQQMHGGISMVDLAMVHEFGAPSVHIPQRSFIRATADRFRAKYLDALGKLMIKVYERKMKIEQALGIVALMMSTDMKKNAPGTPPPNAPSTIARKGSDVTLVDSGKMIGAITWAVEKKDGAA